MSLPSPILFVCYGNLCRSPFAARCMQRCLARRGLQGETFSRGLLALPGQRPPPLAQKVAREFGVDLSGHAAQPLLGIELQRAAMVLVMEPEQRARLAAKAPNVQGKLFMLTHVAPPPLTDTPVADPMGHDEADFRRVYRWIRDLVDAWTERLISESV